MNKPEYLGDGVYAHVDDSERVVLTTGNHSPCLADSVIVLEPEVLAAFQNWLAKPKSE